jgi:hypothetical protein
VSVVVELQVRYRTGLHLAELAMMAVVGYVSVDITTV